MDHSNRIMARIVLIFYLGLIAFACFGHFDKLPEMSPYFLGIPKDKVVHFLMFFPLPFLMWLALDKYTTKAWHSLLFMIGAFLVGCLIAAATEVGQYYTGYRTADALDFLADTLAMALCSLLVFILDIAKQE